MVDQAENLRALMSKQSVDERRSHRVVAIASGKGGVGKSNFCVNFALGLQRAGYRPIVIDADVGFADIEVLLGIRPRKNIVDVIEGLPIWEALEYDASGLPFLSASNGLLNIHDLSAEQVERLMEELKKLQDKYDIVLIDSGAGLGQNLIRLLAAADDLVLVTTPEPTAIADCYALLKKLVARGEVPFTRMVVNRVKNLSEGKLTADKLRAVAHRFLDVELGVLGYLLEDSAVQSAVKRQEALLSAFPTSPASRCIEQTVRNFMNKQPTHPRKGLAGFVERLLRRRLPEGFDSSHTA
ncbi:MinD/ParA family protein [Alicyclobacillus pomorum]|uniref:MinD/ParA family protein n=1 Tax=Alicyclobacillus pomorum TaxID=204470 RepID=UPI0004011568|nr:MinD/ParA family protein [Alicyclobacillus pomorum]